MSLSARSTCALLLDRGVLADPRRLPRLYVLLTLPIWLVVTFNWSHDSLVHYIRGTQLRTATTAVGQ